MSDDLGFVVLARIGPDSGSLEDVRVQPFVEYRVTTGGERTLDALVRGGGEPEVIWTFPDMLLDGEQYYQFKALVGDDLSAPVAIQTPTQNVNTVTYTPQVVTYDAIMRWPESDVVVINYNRWQIPSEGIRFTNLTIP